MEAEVAMSGVSDTEILMPSHVEDNTSQGKNWIFDSTSMVHECIPDLGSKGQAAEVDVTMSSVDTVKY